MEFATRNPQMMVLLEQAKRLAGSEHTLLLQGEGGTGKRRLALYIHTNSHRAVGPFVTVDCTTVPQDGWESELFGCTRSAFTRDNREGKPGKFTLASGGTLFLNEIGNLSLPIQDRLLHVLPDRRLDSAGVVKFPGTNLRVVAATTRDLHKAMERGLFRKELYDRLSLFRLTIPPLRERREDIELLTREMLAVQAERGIAPELTAEAIATLLLYPWPGNIRELEHALQGALLLANSQGLIGVHHLPPEISSSLIGPPPRQLFRRYIKSAEMLLIRWALSVCSDDRTRAARFLGLSRAALYKKLKLYPEFGVGAAGP